MTANRHTGQILNLVALFLAFVVSGCKTLPALAQLILVFAVLGGTPFLLHRLACHAKSRYFAAKPKTKQLIKN
jgi:hypothetical protein